MTQKVVFLDVDGTLVDYENHLPQSAVEAVQRARANGHLVYICTGRSHAEVQPELWDMGLDGMIGGNGSYVEHQGTVLMHQVISEEDSRAIVDWLHERGWNFTWKAIVVSLPVSISKKLLDQLCGLTF